jgi:hypothetical protein
MKKFLLKSAIFITGFWLCCILMASIADRVSPMNVYAKGEAERLIELMDKKDTLQAISLGNSHGGAIDFRALGLEGEIVARAGTDLLEVKQYAYSIVPKLPALETVFIPVSYFSFSRNNLLADDTRNLRIELYSILPTWAALPGEAEYLILGKIHRYFRIMSVVRPDHWHEVISTALADNSVGGSLQDNWVQSTTPWGVCYHFTQSDLEAIGNEIGTKAANNHLNIVEANPNIREQSYQALADSVEMLQTQGVRVVLFTPPYHISYNNRFYEIAPDMIDSMHKAIESLQNKYNIEYYDASTMEEFSIRPELFYNSDHLNECGARAFSEYLLKEMNNR